MLIEEENWAISSGNCGEQRVAHPRVLSTESVEPCGAGARRALRSGIPGPGSWAAPARGRVPKTVPEHRARAAPATRRRSSQGGRGGAGGIPPGESSKPEGPRGQGRRLRLRLGPRHCGTLREGWRSGSGETRLLSYDHSSHPVSSTCAM